MLALGLVLLSVAPSQHGREFVADRLSAVTYAIYKPRNVLSTTVPKKQERGSRATLRNLMIDADVQLLSGHIGRLDAETSGLILVTADSLLLRSILGWPDATRYGGKPLNKRYELLILGRYAPDSQELKLLGTPLEFQKSRREVACDAAIAIEHKGSFRDVHLATGDASLIDRIDLPQVQAQRVKLAKARVPGISRKTGQPVPLYVPADGWVTRVEVVLSQGRHHQIRRLCRRAKLKLLHLKRLSVGPIELSDEMQPGDVRELNLMEKQDLYEHCLPRLLCQP